MKHLYAVIAMIVVMSLAVAPVLALSAWDQALLEMPNPSGVVLGPWYMAGPFAHDNFWVDAKFQPEDAVDLSATYTGKNGQVSWQEMTTWTHERTKHNFFDVLDFPTDKVDCYAYRRITSPANMDAYIYYGSDDSMAAWLNGKEIVKNQHLGQCFPRERLVEIQLRKGDNDLLVKVGNNDQGFEFYCEIQPLLSLQDQSKALEALIVKFPTDVQVVDSRFKLMELYTAQDKLDSAEGQYRALFTDKSLDKDYRSLLDSVGKYRAQGTGWVNGYSEIPGGAELRTTGGKLLVRFVKQGLARLTFIPNGVEYPLSDKYRPLPVGEIDTISDVKIGSNDSEVTVANGVTSVAVKKATGAIELSGPEGRRTVVLTCVSENTVADISTIPGEDFFGGGEQFNGLNQRGKSISLGNSDRSWGGQYLNLPFVMTSSRDGFYLNSYGTGNLAMDNELYPDRLHMQLQERVADLFWSTGAPKKIVGDYCALTGYPQMPPDWAFPVWFSRNSYGNEKEVLLEANKLREENIPSGVLVLEAWREGDDGMAHEDWTKWGTKQKWPDPEGLCEKLHSLDYKVVLWTMPWYMVQPSKLWPWESEGMQNGYFLKEKNGDAAGFEKALQWCSISPDFTNPAAVKWNEERYLPLLDKVKGADAFKTDMGENTDGLTYKGWKGMSNLFTTLYQKRFYEMVKEETGEGVVFSRTGGIGTQSYPILWSGDIWAHWPGIGEAISGMLSSATCGYSFTSSDVGGYWGDPITKVYIRWMQLGCFQPIMQFHGQSPREPWHIEGDTTVPICRYYTDLHTRLIPYIKEMGQLSCKTGVPIVRPMWMEMPDDKDCYKVQDQYFFGPDFVVAPIYHERDTRDIYLPKGKWIDWWTGKTITGPSKFSITADLDKIPVYIKANSKLVSFRPEDGKGLKQK